MADVQLERGYVRVANRVVEAVLAAPFNSTQTRIVLALIRLTYGWRRRTVKCTATELLVQAGVTTFSAKRAGGNARNGLAELVHAGVILRVDGAKGSPATTWGIQKDHAQWGKFSVADARLAAQWDERPESDDAALRDFLRMQSEDDYMAHDEATSVPSNESETWPEDGPPSERDMAYTQATLKTTWPVDGPPDGLSAGHVNGRKSLNGETLQRPKDRKDSWVPLDERTPLAEASNTREPEPLPPAAAGPAAATAAANATANRLSEPHRDMLVRLSTAVYHAVCARWGEPTRPIPFGTGSQLAADLIAAGVAWPSVEVAIKRVCEKKSGGAPTSLEYFRAAIFEAHEAAAEKAIIAHAQHRPAGGAQAVAALLGRETPGDRDRKADEALRDEYDHARREAAEAWANDPANAGAVRIISAKAQLELGASVYGHYGDAALASAIRLRCAERAGFPDFDAWKNLRKSDDKPECVPKQGITLSAAE